MSTPDRTTIKAAVAALVDDLRSDLTAEPPTAGRPFRHVEEGPARFDEYVRPFLTVEVMRVEPIGSTEGDRVLRVALALRLVADVVSADPHQAILDAVAAVEDYFDDLIDDEEALAEGADGFEDRIWSFGYPSATSGVRVAEAKCTQSFAVRIERGHNRVA